MNKKVDFMKRILLLITILLISVLMFSACEDKQNGTSNNKENEMVNKVVEIKSFDLTLPSKEFDYDGEAHYLELEGEKPANSIISWQNNGLTEVGEKTVSVSVRCAGYADLNLNAKLSVKGVDFSNEIGLVNDDICVDYAQDYAFELSNTDKLPNGYSLTEKYLDKVTNVLLDEKADYGGTFRYIAVLNANGYNKKILCGDLTINPPTASSVKIVNIPMIFGTKSMLKGLSWEPKAEAYPKGHLPVEFEFYSSDENIISFENGKFMAKDYGMCEVGVKIKGTEMSFKDYITVEKYDYSFEDFEDDSKTLYAQVDGAKDPSVNYYDAYNSVGTEGKILEDNNGNHYLRGEGMESYFPYYSFIGVSLKPDNGWTAGRYVLEMDAKGNYPFYFYWAKNEFEVYYIIGTFGKRNDSSSIVTDGKLRIAFTLKDEDIEEFSEIRFAQSTTDAFDYEIDNILLIKVPN